MNTLRTQMERLQQAINDGSVVAKTTAAKTHFHKHEHVTDVESMNRMLCEVPANSAFYPNQNIEFLLEEAMFYKAQDIAEWLDTAEPREKKAFQVVFDPEDYDGMIGKGFVNDQKSNLIKEYESDTLNLVLQQDSYSSLGFSIVTAYPSLDSPTVKPTMRNLKNVTMQTDMYQSADPVKKAYMLYRTSYQSTLSVSYREGTYGPEDSTIFLHVPTVNPNTKHVIKIKESGVTLTTKTFDPITKEKTTIPTKYTQLRDTLFENPPKNLAVSLNNRKLKEEFKKDFPEVMREVSYIKHKIRENLPTASNFQNEKTLMTQEVRKQSELVPVTKSREIPDLPYQEPTQESAFEYTK